MSVLITENYKGKKYEEFARKKQIKDVSQMKQDLEKKLMTVEMELDLLKAREFSTPNYKNDFKMPIEKQKDIDDFIKKKVVERRELERRRNERVAKMMEDMKKKEENLKQSENSMKEYYKKERIERIQKNIDDIQERMKSRKEENESWKQTFKELKKNAPPDPVKIFEETQKALMEKTVQEELNKIKEKAKPIDPEELKEFMKKYDEEHRVQKEEKLKELKQVRKELKNREKEWSSGVFYSKAEEEANQKMNQLQKLQEILDEKKNKVQSFEKKRKELFLPKINEDKKEQVKNEIQKLNSHKIKRLISKKHEDVEPLEEWDPREAEAMDPRVKGKEYLEYVRGLKKKESGTKSAEDLSRIEEKGSTLSEKEKVRKPDNFLKDKKVIAWLSKDQKCDLKSLKNIVNDASISENDKRDLIKAQAATWEEKARMKEEELRLKPKNMKKEKKDKKANEIPGYKDDFDEINELYLKSVKAKLALFKGS